MTVSSLKTFSPVSVYDQIIARHVPALQAQVWQKVCMLCSFTGATPIVDHIRAHAWEHRPKGQCCHLFFINLQTPNSSRNFSSRLCKTRKQRFTHKHHFRTKRSFKHLKSGRNWLCTHLWAKQAKLKRKNRAKQKKVKRPLRASSYWC